jgi:hypothetical protein
VSEHLLTDCALRPRACEFASAGCDCRATAAQLKQHSVSAAHQHARLAMARVGRERELAAAAMRCPPLPAALRATDASAAAGAESKLDESAAAFAAFRGSAKRLPGGSLSGAGGHKRTLVLDASGAASETKSADCESLMRRALWLCSEETRDADLSCGPRAITITGGGGGVSSAPPSPGTPQTPSTSSTTTGSAAASSPGFGFRRTSMLIRASAAAIAATERVGLGGSDSLLTSARASHSVTDAHVRTLAERAPALQTLSLAGCARVTDEALAALSLCCPRLQAIDLMGCERVSEGGLAALAVGCPLLTELHGEVLVAGAPAHCMLVMRESLPFVHADLDRAWPLLVSRDVAGGCRAAASAVSVAGAL